MNTAFKIIMAAIYFWLFSINKKILNSIDCNKQ